MDHSFASPTISAARFGLKIFSAYKRPYIDVYYDLVHKQEEHEYEIDGKNKAYKHQDVRLILHLVNIGGTRAEEITADLDGDLVSGMQKLANHPIFREGYIIPSMAPSQSISLCQTEMLHPSVFSESAPVLITIAYDPPAEGWRHFTGFNWILKKILRKKSLYKTQFRFSLEIFNGVDIPAPQ